MPFTVQRSQTRTKIIYTAPKVRVICEHSGNLTPRRIAESQYKKVWETPNHFSCRGRRGRDEKNLGNIDATVHTCDDVISMSRPLSTPTPNEAERGRSLSLEITENAKNTMDITLMQTQGIGPPLVFVFQNC